MTENVEPRILIPENHSGPVPLLSRQEAVRLDQSDVKASSVSLSASLEGKKHWHLEVAASAVVLMFSCH